MATTITGDSPEAVALALLEAIALAERKPLNHYDVGLDKEWILSTYRECLAVVLVRDKLRISEDVLARARQTTAR